MRGKERESGGEEEEERKMEKRRMSCPHSILRDDRPFRRNHHNLHLPLLNIYLGINRLQITSSVRIMVIFYTKYLYLYCLFNSLIIILVGLMIVIDKYSITLGVNNYGTLL